MQKDNTSGAGAPPFDPAVLLALADRCEREAPSADLNEAIERATGGIRSDCIIWFTTSLDAAVTLVPEGWRWAVGPLPLDCGGANASAWRDSRNPAECAFNIQGRTPALALCAAALRARAAAAEHAQSSDPRGKANPISQGGK